MDRCPVARVNCERVFAPDLDGTPWSRTSRCGGQFPLLSNRSWFSGKFVLIGDALRTVHFSMRLRERAPFEDAIALGSGIREAGEDVPRALAAFERRSAGRSWKKLLAAGERGLVLVRAFSGKDARGALAPRLRLHDEERRMTDARLRELAPRFMRRVEAGRTGGS